MIVRVGDFQVNIHTFPRPDTTFTDLHLLGSKPGSLTGCFSRFCLGEEGVWRSHSSVVAECGAIVICRLTCRRYCTFHKQCKYSQIILPSNSPNESFFMRKRTGCYVLPMQSAGYELCFDPVMMQPLRFRDLWTTMTWPPSKETCREILLCHIM